MLINIMFLQIVIALNIFETEKKSDLFNTFQVSPVSSAKSGCTEIKTFAHRLRYN